MLFFVYRENDNAVRFLVSSGHTKEEAELLIQEKKTRYSCKDEYYLLPYGAGQLNVVLQEHNINH